MGLYDRDYTRADYRPQFSNIPQMRFTLPRITPVVKWLLIINIAVFFAGALFLPNNAYLPVLAHPVNLLEKWCSVFPYSLGSSLQLWRLVTYQFLHGGIGHILLNMLGLFFLGPTLERHWGSKKFLIFYLSCGIAGGAFYTLLVALNFLQPLPMIGASGSILGMLAACAILFPHFIVFIMFFPVPIRVAAIGLTLVYLFFVMTRAPNAGGDAAHLAGMAAGAGYVLFKPALDKFKMKTRSGTRKRKIDAQYDLEAEVDRILQKVHDHGIHSLTAGERRILRKATETEQKRHRL